ncbi:MAG: sulfite oxidase, partial [Congregibacter sp.]
MSDIKGNINTIVKQQAKALAHKHQLYQQTPINRRSFLSGLATMTTLIGSEIVFARFMPVGFIPVAFAQTLTPFLIPGKDSGLVVLNDRPINAETPAHLLNDNVTPADKLFVRNNGIAPQKIDVENWTL